MTDLKICDDVRGQGSTMATLGDGRGVLYPHRLPSFHRVTAPPQLQELVRWFWIPRWNLAPGRVSRQNLLPFPASNIVVEPEAVTLSGPTTGASYRDLRGQGWAVGALLRPAGLASLHAAPASIRDDQTPYDAPDLHLAVSSAMKGADPDAGRDEAAAAFTAWVTEYLTPPDESARRANALEDLIANNSSITRVDQAAEELSISTRGLQRLAHRYFGLAPLAIIRRYRLQEAAQRVRDSTTVTIAQVAADLGYSDHAHLDADFRRVLGFTPNSYRQEPTDTR